MVEDGIRNLVAFGLPFEIETRAICEQVLDAGMKRKE